jgi:arabinose-5-phosphate isomerase
MNDVDSNDLLATAKRVLDIEARAVAALAARLDGSLVEASRLCLECTGRVVVIGMGKSGHIGGKIAATLASTGTPAFFVHAGEASHGDMGMITTTDVVLAISNSGETREIADLLPVIQRLSIPMITLTGRADSTLAVAATVNLDVSVAEEACPMNLAPTASTTAALAMGDALAIALLQRRGFSSDDFARTHPGGTLGRRLLIHVADVMHQSDAIPSVQTNTPIRDGLLQMTKKSLGMTAVVDGHGRLQGVFTDGDLRRALDDKVDVHTDTMASVMTQNPKTVAPEQLAYEALELMQNHKITALLVVDENDQLIGALNIHDLFRAGIM